MGHFRGEGSASVTEPNSLPVGSVAFSPTGTTLATANLNGHTYLWNVHNGTLAGGTFTDPGGKGAPSVAFSPTGATLATADYNGHTYLWNVLPWDPGRHPHRSQQQ